MVQNFGGEKIDEFNIFLQLVKILPFFPMGVYM